MEDTDFGFDETEGDLDEEADVDVEDAEETEPPGFKQKKVKTDDEDDEDDNAEEDEEDEEDDGEDEDDDEGNEEKFINICKRRAYAYHQIPESTTIHIIPADKRVTSEYMTLSEYANVIGIRATHIAAGSVIYTDLQCLDNPRDIAMKEIEENKCPLCVTRKISPSEVEIWEVNEMIKPML